MFVLATTCFEEEHIISHRKLGMLYYRYLDII